MVRRKKVGWVIAVLCVVCVSAGGQAPKADAEEGVVYFQVSYKNGEVRDLSRVPSSDRGIIRVTRIARFELPGSVREVRVLSTHGPDDASQQKGVTVRTELVWNSRAWVAPLRVPSEPAAATRPAAVTTAPATTTQPATTTAPATANAADGIATGSLSAPRQMRQIPTAGGVGVIEQAGVLSHRVQVWPIAQGKGSRTVSVAIAHAEAGAFGAFHFVAYADTNADGVPDKLIARSMLAEAQQPGQWSTWTFATDQQRVFVGNTWPRREASHFRRRRGRGQKPPEGYSMPDEIFISGHYGAVPTEKHDFWPYLHNIRLKLTPAAPTDDSSEPEMIIEQR